MIRFLSMGGCRERIEELSLKYKASERTSQLYSYLDMVLPQTENKTSALEKTQQLYQASGELLKKYEVHYLKDEVPDELLPIWEGSENTQPAAVHEMIRQAAEELIKNRRL